MLDLHGALKRRPREAGHTLTAAVVGSAKVEVMAAIDHNLDIWGSHSKPLESFKPRLSVPGRQVPLPVGCTGGVMNGGRLKTTPVKP